MTNHEKMIELAGSEADKETIKQWGYMNRITVSVMDYEKNFECMEDSVKHFMESKHYSEDEDENWDKFLDAEFVEGVNT